MTTTEITDPLHCPVCGAPGEHVTVITAAGPAAGVRYDCDCVEQPDTQSRIDAIRARTARWLRP